MRFLYFLILLVIVAAVVVFALQNSESIAIKYPDQHLSIQSITLPLSLLVGAVYLLGMLSGWTVVGFLKRTVERVTERPANRD